MPHLLIHRNGVLALRVRLSRQRMSIGSNSGCEVFLADPELRPVHAFIERIGGAHVLVDSAPGSVPTRLWEEKPIALGKFTVALEKERARNEVRTERRPDLGVAPTPTHVCIKEPGRTWRIEVADLLTFGTHESNAVCLASRFVSGNHCKLERAPDGFWVEDLGSTNGTFVNGARVQRAQVQAGSVVGLGDVELRLEIEGESDQGVEQLVGTDPVLLALVEFAQRVAPSEHPVLILGETGTGKELFARLIHARSRRAAGPFVAINCATIGHSTMEAELFGYEKGAFTGAEREHPGFFEQAHGGTLFLDELGELPKEQQAKLLRALQDGKIRRLGAREDRKVDVRVVAATRAELREAVKQGHFRDDLFYRLATIPLEVPPLRRRGSDILRLADHFLAELAPEGTPPRTLSALARAKLEKHSWPGNIRELKSVLMHAHFLQPDAHAALEPEHLRFPAGEERSTEAPPQRSPGLIESRGKTLEQIELEVILDRVEQFEGDKEAAARSLGISRSKVYEVVKAAQSGKVKAG